MPDSLFRSQAVDARRTRLLGDVILQQPLGPSLPALLLASSTALAIAFLAWASYTRKETLCGVVMPEQGLIELYAPRSGTLPEARVAEAVCVSAGQVLAREDTRRPAVGGVDGDEIRAPEADIALDRRSLLDWLLELLHGVSARIRVHPHPTGGESRA